MAPVWLLVTGSCHCSMRRMVSGLFLSGAKSGYNAIQFTRMGQEAFDTGSYRDYISLGLLSDHDSEAYRYAEEIRAKLNAGRAVTNIEMGQLTAAVYADALGVGEKWSAEAREDMDEDIWERVFNEEDDAIQRALGEGLETRTGSEHNREVELSNVDQGDIITPKQLNIKITERGEVVNPMDEEDYDRIGKRLSARGIEVLAATEGDDLRYMLAIGAEGSYSHGRISHIGAIPSRGTLFEEIIHASQAKMYGELSETDFVELYAREIEANRKLLKNKRAYKLDVFDVEDIERNLASWEEKFLLATGVSYDDSNYRG